MVLLAPRSAKLVESHGARFTLLCGYVFCLVGFVWMLVFWKPGIAYFHVGIAYACIGAGVGLAGTPASRSLTGAVPVRRAGMASGTADLQRDLGGAIMQSIFGALLTAGYAASFSKLIAGAPNGSSVSTEVQGQLTKSFSSAENTAQQYPQYASQIIKAAQTSFVDGQDWAYFAGIVAVLLGDGARLLHVPASRPRARAARGVPPRGRRARRRSPRSRRVRPRRSPLPPDERGCVRS